MKNLLLLDLAFVLGVNPYSHPKSRTLFYSFGTVWCIYVLLVGGEIVYQLIRFQQSSYVIAAIVYRTCITCYFVIDGLLNFDEKVAFYRKIFSAAETPGKKYYSGFDVAFLILFIAILPEIVVITSDNVLKRVMYLSSATLNALIPLVTMMHFSVCCGRVQFLYAGLQEDISHTFPRSASFTLRRLRARHVDIIDLVRDVGQKFGMRLLLYILQVQLILLEKTDFLVAKFTSNTCPVFVPCWVVLVSFIGYLVMLWYFSYNAWKTAGKQAEVLAAVMELPTKDMDASGVQEAVELSEELLSRPALFSAAGCFVVGFPIFYSVIGIVFSYMMIVGPIALKKNRYQVTG